MVEPMIEQRADEDIMKAFSRAHAMAVATGKAVVLATTDGVKLRVFVDDEPDDAKERWMGELERASLLFVMTPDTMGPKVLEAIEAAENGPLGHAYVRETEYRIMVPVVPGDTVETVVQRLNDEFGRLVEAGEIEPKKRPELSTEGVPIADGLVSEWDDLHPMMKSVVIAGLRTLMEQASFKVAQSQAHQVALMATVDALGEQLQKSGNPAAVMSGSMMEGMVAGMGSAKQAEVAQRNAFELAIKRLGG